MLWFALLILITVRQFYGDGVIGQLLGPANVSIDKITECPGSYPNRLKTTLKNVNASYYTMDFDMQFKNDIDDTTMIDINLYRKFGETYLPNYARIIDRNVCDFAMKNAKSTLDEIFNQTNKPTSCPVEKGKYSAKNIGLSLAGIPEVLPYGNFKADVNLIKNNVKILCQQIYATSTRTMRK